MVGASAALHISEIPLKQPIGGVIVGRVDGEFIINPVLAQAENSDMHLVVAGTSDAVMMVEAGAKEVPEDLMLEAISYGHGVVSEIVNFIENWEKPDHGPKEKFVPEIADPENEMLEAVTSAATEGWTRIPGVSAKAFKHARDNYIVEIKAGILQRYLKNTPKKKNH